MTLDQLEREAAANNVSTRSLAARCAMAYPRLDAPGQPMTEFGPVPRPIIATIRRTRSTEFVQFTYCGKRISRERAKELLET